MKAIPGTTLTIHISKEMAAHPGILHCRCKYWSKMTAMWTELQGGSGANHQGILSFTKNLAVYWETFQNTEKFMKNIIIGFNILILFVIVWTRNQNRYEQRQEDPLEEARNESWHSSNSRY